MTEAHVTVEVEVDPATAFDLFTRDGVKFSIGSLRQG
jgi:hypothetical protein